MHTRLAALFLASAAVLVTTTAALAQKPTVPSAAEQTKRPSQSAPAPDYSKEPLIYEKIFSQVAFANNGTYAYDTLAKVKIQSEAAVQSLSIIKFPYASANGSLTIVYLRIRKPDGTVIDTPQDTFQDMPSEISREAPFYSDIREKQVAVKGLEVGDELEYEYRGQVKKPLARGQFWYAYNFTKNAIVLDEELQISMPKDRHVFLGSEELKPATRVKGDERIYAWRTANLQHHAEDSTAKVLRAFDAPPADVLLSTFPSWDAVGEWYADLATPRAVPTPAIRAQAEALTKGLTTTEAKIRAVYNYVSLNFRYVGIAFGIGRYQPHAAADVLANAYGDCKDKETLLVSLLAAVGVKAYPALVNSSHKIDPSVPSPGQFDHVIAAVPQAGGYLWLDTTTEVAPPGFLLANLRGREALVILDGGNTQLVKIPSNPPFPSRESFHADATLSKEGTLEAKIKLSSQGDSEILFRLAFRSTPEEKWPDLLHVLSLRWGFGGTVKNAVLSPINTTDPLLVISYDYTRDNYSDWTEKKISPPFPPFFLPSVGNGKNNLEPVRLGAPGRRNYSASIALPEGFAPTLPAAVNLVEDFAEYHATYAFTNGALRVQRELTVKLNKVPSSDQDKYKEFLKGVNDDVGQLITLRQAGVAVAYQPSAQVIALYNQGRQAWQERDIDGALNYFQRAVTLDPKYGLGWMALGTTHFMLGSRDQGIDEMKKAIAVDPGQISAYAPLAFAQMAMQHPEDALATWRKLEKVDPQNGEAPANAGSILLSLKRYLEASSELQTAVKREPANANLFESLGLAYTHLADSAKATSAFSKALQLDSSPLMMNNVAFSLADANMDLPAALQDSQKAVEQEEALTARISLDTLTYADLQHTQELGAFWDTLGWVYFRMGQTALAEKYVRASWDLDQGRDLADHLGQIYEKEGRSKRAIQFYAFALASSPGVPIFPPGTRAVPNVTLLPALGVNAMPNTRKHLVHLLGSESRADEAISKARDDLSNVRTAKLPKIINKSAIAEFFLLFAKGPKVSAAKFISGADALRNAAKYFSSAKFNVSFPDDSPALLVRRGVLDCEPELTHCELVLYPPESVHSLN